MYTLVALLLLGWTGDLDKQDFQVVGPTPVVAAGPPLSKEQFCLICGEPKKQLRPLVVRAEPAPAREVQERPAPRVVREAPAPAPVPAPAPRIVTVQPQTTVREVRVVPYVQNTVPVQNYVPAPQYYQFGGFGGAPMSGGINCGTGG